MPAVRTPEASQLFHGPFLSQAEAIYHDTNLQLIGSIGREVIMSSYGYEHPPLTLQRPDGDYRDIDALDHGGANISAMPQHAKGPLKVDLECNKWVVRTENGVWITFPGDPSVAEEVRPEVFEPVTRYVGDVACRTYSVATQQKINRLSVFERPKDKKAFFEYDGFVTSLDPTNMLAADLPLPDTFYRPFAQFSQGLREKHKGYFWIRRIGVAVDSLPSGLQKCAKQMSAPVRRHYLG